MRAFNCPACGNLLAFENTVCLRCSAQVGFAPDHASMHLVDREYARCSNVRIAGCNWLVTASRAGLCDSCRLTRTRPADADSTANAQFIVAEAAKRRLIYQLDDLGLAHPADGSRRLAFDLLSSAGQPVTTGHADGLITMDLAEGNDAHREALRSEMEEPYRTLLGHFRHETGHYYWDMLVADSSALLEFRDIFGDERLHYADALAEHYSQGPPTDWEQRYVSAYATTHPWEDWAETFAHYLHIRDTLQTASSFGVVIAGPDLPDQILAAVPTEQVDDFDDLLSTWHPFTLALNAVNRSMGHTDLYPFVLAPPALWKLRFVHRLVTA